MDFIDIITLAIAYGSYVVAVFGISYGASSLWALFKALSAPGNLHD